MPLRSEIDKFKTNLIELLNKVDESEREENHFEELYGLTEEEIGIVEGRIT